MVIGTPTNAGNKTQAYVEGWSRKEGAERERGIERQMTTPLAQRPLKNQTHCSAATGLDMVTMDTDMDIGTADTPHSHEHARKFASMHACMHFHAVRAKQRVRESKRVLVSERRDRERAS